MGRDTSHQPGLGPFQGWEVPNSGQFLCFTEQDLFSVYPAALCPHLFETTQLYLAAFHSSPKSSSFVAIIAQLHIVLPHRVPLQFACWSNGSSKLDVKTNCKQRKKQNKTKKPSQTKKNKQQQQKKKGSRVHSCPEPQMYWMYWKMLVHWNHRISVKWILLTWEFFPREKFWDWLLSWAVSS